ncbi:hypothetical protein DFH09DRAFT_10890 [Mycena vulgaris]|nr:hypothetical protein DFH09DRAFT_10890 [Mycena vulgaris]
MSRPAGLDWIFLLFPCSHSTYSVQRPVYTRHPPFLHVECISLIIDSLCVLCTFLPFCYLFQLSWYSTAPPHAGGWFCAAHCTDALICH